MYAMPIHIFRAKVRGPGPEILVYCTVHTYLYYVCMHDENDGDCE